MNNDDLALLHRIIREQQEKNAELAAEVQRLRGLLLVGARRICNEFCSCELEDEPKFHHPACPFKDPKRSGLEATTPGREEG